MFNLFKQRRRKRLRSQPFPPAWLDIIKKNVPVYNRLPQADQLERVRSQKAVTKKGVSVKIPELAEAKHLR